MQATFKSYSEKSKAKRALVQVFKVDADKVDQCLFQEDGKWGIWLSDNVPMNVHPNSHAVDDADTAEGEALEKFEQEQDFETHPDDPAYQADAPTDDEPTGSPSPSAFAGFAMSQLTAESNKPQQDEPVRAPATTTGLKIEKDRPMQNGVKRPSAGGMCRAVWDALDEFRSTHNGSIMSAGQVKELAVSKGWNANNASIEFYQWRKFNGIKGRQK